MSDQPLPPCSGSVFQPGQTPKPKPVRALVADDDADTRRALSEILSRAGYEVDAAADGALAWDTLQRTSYDILITDNRMPKMSGVELLDKLRMAKMKLPVIMITSLVPQHEFTKRPWLIPDATVLKPFKTAELLGKIGILLGARNESRLAIETSTPGPSALGMSGMDALLF